MIIDKLENLYLYQQIPQYIAEFIKNEFPNIDFGRYDFGENYLNVETYTTKNITDGKFESHKNYIDIQILLSGKEKIYYTNTNNLKSPLPYDSERDIMFYGDDIENYDYVTLDGSNFALIYPHEAHAPQIAPKTCSKVKKAVFKLSK